MIFNSKIHWLLIWVNIFTLITCINPLIPTFLKILSALLLLVNLYLVLSKYTVILEEDHLIYERRFLSFTIFHKYIPYKSVKKVEYNLKFLMLHPINMESFYFNITTPEFIFAMEKLCEKQQITYEYVV